MEALKTSTKTHSSKSSKSKENSSSSKHKETSNNHSQSGVKSVKNEENKTNNAPIVNSTELTKPDLAQINNNYNKLLENNRVIIIMDINLTKIDLSIGYIMIIQNYYCFFFKLKNMLTNNIPLFMLELETKLNIIKMKIE